MIDAIFDVLKLLGVVCLIAMLSLIILLIIIKGLGVIGVYISLFMLVSFFILGVSKIS